MNDILTYILPALIGALPSLVALSWLGKKYKAETRKADVEVENLLVEATKTLLPPLRERISELERRVKELEEQQEKNEGLILTLRNGAARLQVQVTDMGAEPVFVVPVYEPIKRRKKRGGTGSIPHSSG